MTAVYYVLVIMVGYFCGCIESGYLVGKLCGMDIRDYGSGNSGTCLLYTSPSPRD